MQNAFDAIVVFKECVEGRTPAWFFKLEAKSIHRTEMRLLKKKQLSEETIKLLVECYQESADEDLSIAEEFQGIENELDDKYDTKG